MGNGGASDLSGRQTSFHPISRRDGRQGCLSAPDVQWMGAGRAMKGRGYPGPLHPMVTPPLGLTKPLSAFSNPCLCKQDCPTEATSWLRRPPSRAGPPEAGHCYQGNYCPPGSRAELCSAETLHQRPGRFPVGPSLTWSCCCCCW